MASKIATLWGTLKKPSAKYSLIALLTVGFFSGVFFWGGFNTAMEATNTLEFCISCHEMRDNVYQEYKHHSLQQSHRRAGHMFRLPCTQRLVAQNGAQNSSQCRIVGKVDGHDRYQGKIRGQSLAFG